MSIPPGGLQLSPNQLALLRRRLPATNARAANSMIERRLVSQPALLSFAQERFWLLDQLAMAAATYNIPIILHLDGALDQRALAYSLATLLDRHAALRTAIVPLEGCPTAQIESVAPLDLTPIDLRHLPAVPRTAEVARHVKNAAHTTIDLTHAPLLRASLVQVEDTRYQLLLTFHHVCFDAWSLGIFTRELSALYTAYAQHRPHTLPPLPCEYADFAAWQRSPQQHNTHARQLDYWKQQLGALPPVLNLPTDFPRTAQANQRGEVQICALADVSQAQLHALSHGSGATPFMILLAAFELLLARCTGQTEIIVGSPVAGRTQSATEDLIGCFVNTLALRSTVAGASSFGVLVQRVRNCCLAAYANQDVPFDQVVAAVQTSHARAPLFQVMFEVAHATPECWEMAALTARIAWSDTHTAKCDLILHLTQHAAGLRAEVEYDSTLFAPASITRLLAHYQALLGTVLAAPDQPLDLQPLTLNDAVYHSMSAVPETAARATFADRTQQLPAAKQRLIEQRLLKLAESRRLPVQPARGPQPPLIAIQPAGTIRPIFLVHPIGGGVLCYMPLAQQLGRDQPCYGLEACGLHAQPHTSIAQMAAAYIQAIQQVQISGPYVLGGWSFGGVVALEIAQQLHAANQEIQLLAVFDSQLPLADCAFPARSDAELLHMFARDVASLRAAHAPPDMRQDEQLFAVYRANYQALRMYQPQPFHFCTALFSAAARDTQRLQSWQQLGPNDMVIYPLPGDHYTILAPPHVDLLAAQLQACMAAE